MMISLTLNCVNFNISCVYDYKLPVRYVGKLTFCLTVYLCIAATTSELLIFIIFKCEMHTVLYPYSCSLCTQLTAAT